MVGMKRNKHRDIQAELGVLSEMSNLVGTSLRDDKIFEKMLKLLGKCVEYTSASLFLIDRESGQLDNVAYVGKRVDLIDFVKLS